MTTVKYNRSQEIINKYKELQEKYDVPNTELARYIGCATTTIKDNFNSGEAGKVLTEKLEENYESFLGKLEKYPSSDSERKQLGDTMKSIFPQKTEMQKELKLHYSSVTKILNGEKVRFDTTKQVIDYLEEKCINYKETPTKGKPTFELNSLEDLYELIIELIGENASYYLSSPIIGFTEDEVHSFFNKDLIYISKDKLKNIIISFSDELGNAEEILDKIDELFKNLELKYKTDKLISDVKDTLKEKSNFATEMGNKIDDKTEELISDPKGHLLQNKDKYINSTKKSIAKILKFGSNVISSLADKLDE